MKHKSNLKILVFYMVLIAIIVFAVSRIYSTDKVEQLLFSDVGTYIRSEQVAQLTVDDDYVLTMVLKDGKIITYQLRDLSLFINFYGDEIDRQMAENGLVVEFEPQTETPWWLQLLPTFIVIVVVFVLFFFFLSSQNAGHGGRIGGFGKAKVHMPNPNDPNRVTFKDVAGADEEKEELVEIVDFLKAPEKFTRLGAKIPHGVLLVGPPGTGKTLLAKAVAGEAGVPFFSISGSDFVEMYVGVGASRVRDLFENARKAPASIVFIDEIDAVGRHRGAGLGGGHDEREQTLNQLLVEMDGFGSHDGIIVMAATNRPDILDPALLRPGRFDRQITVSYPDIKGREAILKVHSRNKPLEEEVNLAEVAKTTAGFTGADLANLLNEAALLAARRDKNLIGMKEIEDAFIKVIAGPQKKSRRIKDTEKKKTAYHEAGHALLAYYLPSQDPVQQISIIPSGNALGYTLNPPVEDKYSVYKSELKEEIAMLLGGRAAEEIVFGDISGGASNDIERATKTAKNMVMHLGMSENLGPINYGGESGEVFLGRDFTNGSDHSDVTAAKIDDEIQKIVKEAYELAKSILREHRSKLDFVADYLVHAEMMDAEQFAYAMEHADVTTEDLDAITEERARRSREANAKAPATPLTEEEKGFAKLEQLADELDAEDQAKALPTPDDSESPYAGDNTSDDTADTNVTTDNAPADTTGDGESTDNSDQN